ncbi:DUF3429 domain-containing protein [Pseudotabrizicola sp. L79]|uniref:DUF3429 domain-containing protein n=1 Tax=Pseudotabrizicola sp. L79 TaxID=3118402 RepID=UPI002F9229E2
MEPIPKSALALGLAGLIPFVWGALSVLSPALAGFGANQFGPLFTGTYLSLTYGTVILSFMSGVLWGFATKAEDEDAAISYVLSVIPALWAFFMVNGDPADAAVNLAAGFAGLLLLDWHFWKQGTAPNWWLRMRAGLTAVVLICLAVPILTGR